MVPSSSPTACTRLSESSPFRSQDPAHDLTLELVSGTRVSLILIFLIFCVDSVDSFTDTERKS